MNKILTSCFPFHTADQPIRGGASVEEENDLLESELKGKVSALKSVSKIERNLLLNSLGMQYYETDCYKQSMLNRFSFFISVFSGFIFSRNEIKGR